MFVRIVTSPILPRHGSLVNELELSSEDSGEAELLRPALEGGVPLARVARDRGIALRTAQRWAGQYRRDGLAGLVRKPGAFEEYRYRDSMFPTSRFRMAYDVLLDQRGGRVVKDYLAILLPGHAGRRKPC